MLIFNKFEDVYKAQLKNCRLTIGRFQGVHLGHRHLLSHLGEFQVESPKVVVTFDPAPEDILSGTIHPKISDTDEKIELFKQLGIDIVFFIPFDQSVADLAPDVFVQKYLLDLFKPKKIIVGYDFAYGKKRKGNSETLRQQVPSSIAVLQIDPWSHRGEIVSTSVIRQKILAGDVKSASELLGRYYPLSGVIVDGAKRGRKLGYPTINIKYPPHRILPKSGVYAVNVEIEGESFHGVCNIGFNPTFGQDSAIKVECYILDFDRDVYHKNVTFQFVERLREEKKFQSQEELVIAIKEDIFLARKIFFTPA